MSVAQPLRVLAIDPGEKAGFAASDGRGGLLVTHDAAVVPVEGWDEVVHEAQHSAASLYRHGRRVRVSRKSQQTLSFTAGRLYEKFPARRRYRILPDDWRALLWPGSRRLPKKVVLARLETLVGDQVPASVPKAHRPDVLEARGILEAWSALTQDEKEAYRVD